MKWVVKELRQAWLELENRARIIAKAPYFRLPSRYIFLFFRVKIANLCAPRIVKDHAMLATLYTRLHGLSRTIFYKNRNIFYVW